MKLRFFNRQINISQLALNLGLLACIVMVLAWCFGAYFSTNFYRKRGLVLAFGTINEITLYGKDREKLESAFQAMETFFSNKHDVWHAWKPSLLTDFNDKLQSGHAFLVNNPEFLELIKTTQTLSQATDHYFNPALGHVFQLWNFQEATENPKPPPQEALQPFKDNPPTMNDVDWLDDHLAIGHHPLIQIDLGGIAKGFSVEKAIDYLENLGIKHALVNAGGDIKLIGESNGRPWKVAIRDPWKKHYAIAYLDITGPASVFSSGTYERNFKYQGKQYHHIIDPETMEPTQHGIISVTIIHDNATEADAYATALAAAGPKKIKALAKKLGIQDMLVVFDNHTAWVTKNIENKLHWLEPLTEIKIFHIEDQF